MIQRTKNLLLGMRKKRTSLLLRLKVSGFMTRETMPVSRNTKEEDMSFRQASLNLEQEKLNLMTVQNLYLLHLKASTTGATQLMMIPKEKTGLPKKRRMTCSRRSTRLATG
jgi:hypothetical protein